MQNQIDPTATYNVSFRRIGQRDTLIGKIYTAAGPWCYFDAKRYAEQANKGGNHKHDPSRFFFFVECAE